MDVSRGHLILRDDGGSTVAKRVKFNAVDPAFPHVSPNAEAEGLPREVLEDRQAQSKVERKEEMEFLAKKKLKAEDSGFEGVLQLHGRLEHRLASGKKTTATSRFTGAFVHGGETGTRLNLKLYPDTTRFMTAFGKKFADGNSFSALGLARNWECAETHITLEPPKA